MKGNPRYALVRVDGTIHCPSRYENINRKFVCAGLPYCYKCRYGDTKEQLIKKIMTAFKIAIKKNKEGKFIKEKSTNRQVAEIVAEIVVEFLGVE